MSISHTLTLHRLYRLPLLLLVMAMAWGNNAGGCLADEPSTKSSATAKRSAKSILQDDSTSAESKSQRDASTAESTEESTAESTEELIAESNRQTSNVDKPSGKRCGGVGRLPTYYAGIVDSQQRQAIYDIRARVAVEIEQLQQQLNALREAELAEIEAILSDSQRRNLNRSEPLLPASAWHDSQPTTVRSSLACAHLGGRLNFDPLACGRVEWYDGDPRFPQRALFNSHCISRGAAELNSPVSIAHCISRGAAELNSRGCNPRKGSR